MKDEFNFAEVIQSKAKRSLETISHLKENGMVLQSVEVCIKAQACYVREDGTFFVLTGNKDKPAGVGISEPADLCFIYNEKYGVYVPTTTVIRFIKENRKNLEVGIDEMYENVGVRIPLGAFSTYLDEDFLTALPPFS